VKAGSRENGTVPASAGRPIISLQDHLTLAHGDSHLGNFFETGDEMGMIDFQAAHRSQGIRDVQYFLINSMRPERLAEHELELVAGYCEERLDDRLEGSPGGNGRYRRYSNRSRTHRALE
jgi:thiamine kinase-like enzyme